MFEIGNAAIGSNMHPDIPEWFLYDDVAPDPTQMDLEQARRHNDMEWKCTSVPAGLYIQTARKLSESRTQGSTGSGRSTA